MRDAAPVGEASVPAAAAGGEAVPHRALTEPCSTVCRAQSGIPARTYHLHSAAQEIQWWSTAPARCSKPPRSLRQSCLLLTASPACSIAPGTKPLSLPRHMPQGLRQLRSARHRAHARPHASGDPCRGPGGPCFGSTHHQRAAVRAGTFKPVRRRRLLPAGPHPAHSGPLGSRPGGTRLLALACAAAGLQAGRQPPDRGYLPPCPCPQQGSWRLPVACWQITLCPHPAN